MENRKVNSFDFMIKNKNIYRKEETLMAQLWGGRFTKETDQLVYNFNASISFDQKFYKQDIRGSIAHVTMLASVGVLTEEERDQIIDGLKGISKDIQTGAVEITSEYEDIHSFVEANLIDRIGDVGKKLHTGRSRNDQVALDMKLYTRHEVEEINDLLKMNLSIYAIKVGTTTLSQLDVNKELDIDFYSRPKDNPDYTSSEKKTSDDDTDKNRKLDVYDVLLAGVETND